MDKENLSPNEVMNKVIDDFRIKQGYTGAGHQINCKYIGCDRKNDMSIYEFEITVTDSLS